MEIKLKYGLNPHQEYARLHMPDENPPLRFLNGTPGYINVLDCLGSWQLVRELKRAMGVPGAASFKHVSPAGAAIARPLSDAFRRSQMLKAGEDLSPVAQAYVRARGGDRTSSFGDVAAVSDVVDESLARVFRREVVDAVVAPGFEPKALEILKAKKSGRLLIVQADPDYEPPAREKREVFGVTLEQDRNDAVIDRGIVERVVSRETEIPDDILETLIVATIALKYTQSNSVCVAYDGQVIGMGAGQQSRIHCTRLACAKAEKWMLQQHPRVLGLKFRPGLKRVEKTNVVDQFLLWDDLSEVERRAVAGQVEELPEPISAEEREEWIRGFDGVCISSDAFFPFRDNIDRASRTNVRYLLHPGGSVRDEECIAAADRYGMVLAESGVRCFLH